MVDRNEFTGNALMSKASRNYSKNFDKVDLKAVPEEKVFEIMWCSRCHIKVSTSNKKCPCCGEDLPNG